MKLQALVEQDHFVLWSYTFSNIASRYSKFWEHTGAHLVEWVFFPRPEPQERVDNLEAAFRVYVSNAKMIETIFDAYHIDCFFVLQPLIVTKSPLCTIEQKVPDNLRIGPEGVRFVQNFYDIVRMKLADNKRFIEVSFILNRRAKPDFFDHGHIGPETSPVIGERTDS